MEQFWEACRHSLDTETLLKQANQLGYPFPLTNHLLRNTSYLDPRQAGEAFETLLQSDHELQTRCFFHENFERLLEKPHLYSIIEVMVKRGFELSEANQRQMATMRSDMGYS